ncbi:12370_t:CDS:1, partial [Funneliformis geosporum]
SDVEFTKYNNIIQESFKDNENLQEEVNIDESDNEIEDNINLKEDFENYLQGY